MDIHLTPEFERLVQDKVSAGSYNSASEVVLDALRLLEERDHLLERRKSAIRAKIDEGWEALKRGEELDGESTIAELEAKLDHFDKTRKIG